MPIEMLELNDSHSISEFEPLQFGIIWTSPKGIHFV